MRLSQHLRNFGPAVPFVPGLLLAGFGEIATDDVDGGHRSLLRQWDELDLVARHLLEVSGGPFGLGLFDAVFARGDEIPPDVPRAIERLAAEQRDVRIGYRANGDVVARLEHQQTSA